MHERPPDADLQDVERHLILLSRRVEHDPSHKARLRQELMRRHQELSAASSQRAAGRLQLRFPALKRLTLVAPPALAVLVACAAVLWGGSLPGHPAPRAAEAARITEALVRTVPTVTAWRVTVQQVRGDSAVSVECNQPLESNQRLYVRGDRSYLYSGGRWYRVTTRWQRSGCPADLQIAFAVLPAHLAHDAFTVLPGKVIDGRLVDGIRYSAAHGGLSVTSTVWVDHTSGLVMRGQRILRRGGSVVERDLATYSYTRST